MPTDCSRAKENDQRLGLGMVLLYHSVSVLVADFKTTTTHGSVISPVTTSYMKKLSPPPISISEAHLQWQALACSVRDHGALQDPCEDLVSEKRQKTYEIISKVAKHLIACILGSGRHSYLMVARERLRTGSR